MQSACLTRRVAGAAVVTKGTLPSRNRSTTVVRASNGASPNGNSRRAMLAGFLGGAFALASAKADARSLLELSDDRNVKDLGWDIIDEARDGTLPYAVRDGVAQARQDLNATKQRIGESGKRIESSVGGYIDKGYWTAAREELRLQVGTLRQDINALASSMDKGERKQAMAMKKMLFDKIGDLDYAIRQQNKSKASSALADARAAMKDVLSFVA